MKNSISANGWPSPEFEVSISHTSQEIVVFATHKKS
jgi:hypothetical protein